MAWRSRAVLSFVDHCIPFPISLLFHLPLELAKQGHNGKHYAHIHLLLHCTWNHQTLAADEMIWWVLLPSFFFLYGMVLTSCTSMLVDTEYSCCVHWNFLFTEMQDSSHSQTLASSSLGVPPWKLQSKPFQVSQNLLCVYMYRVLFSYVCSTSFRPNTIIVRNSHRCDWIYVVMSVRPVTNKLLDRPSVHIWVF